MKDPTHIYDLIGATYAHQRRADPRIAATIIRELADTQSVLNVGAGTGSYEPADRFVIGLDPSVTMLKQRPSDSAPCVMGEAEHLPFPDASFDATMAILTIHHWTEATPGLLELARVARQRIVIVTWDPASEGFWLVQRYFPDILEKDRPLFSPMDAFRKLFPDVSVTPLLIPGDCTDGFLGAYWRKPEAYLDLKVRSAISTFSKIGDVERRIGWLKQDLETGIWDQLYGHLRGLSELDVGYRLIVSRLGVSASSRR
jgi:SAM-dependent methyltransferase